MGLDMKPPRYFFDLERAIELGILVLEEPTSPAEEKGTPPERPEPEGDSALFEKFLGLLPWSDDGQMGQREVLHFILGNPGTTVPAIAAHFNVTTSQVVGTINGGLQRNIAKAGFPDRKAILDIVEEGRRKWHYYPGPVLKALGNPRNEKKKKK